MYKVILSDEASKRYKRKEAKTKRKINKCLDELERNPFLGPRIRKLWGELEGNYRYRLGDIRIVYEIDKSQKLVLIKSIKSRGDVYK